MNTEELNECPCCGENPPGPLYKAAIEASSLGPRPNLASLLSMIMHQLSNTHASGVNGEEIDLAYVREIEDGITKLYHAAQAASPAAPSPAHEGREKRCSWPECVCSFDRMVRGCQNPAPQAQPSVRDAVLDEARQACFLLMKPGATYARTIAGCMAAIDDLKTDKGASNG